MTNYGTELYDSSLEKFLNGMDKIINANPLSEREAKALDFLERLYNSRHNIILDKEGNKEKFDLKDLFIGLYYAYYDGIPFNTLEKHKNRITFSNVKEENIGPKIIGLLRKIDNPDDNSLNDFLCIPYNYKTSTDEFIKERVKKLEDKGLIDVLQTYHNKIRIYCESEEDREHFTLLFKKNPDALIKTLQVISTFSLSLRILEMQSKDDNYSSENGYDLYKMSDIDFIVEAVFDKIKGRIEKLKEKKKANEIKSANAQQTKSIINNVLKRYEDTGIYKLRESEFKSIPDDNMLGAILLLKSILIHNNDRDKRICDRLHDNDNLTSLKQIFKESCFSFDNLTIEQAEVLIEKKSLNEIKEILDLFTSTNEYSTSFPIYDILLLSSKEIIIKINQLLKDRKISIEFIENNPEIFIENIPEELQDLTTIKDAKHILLLNNISSLEENSINTYSLSTSSFNSVLLMNNQEIKDRLDLINSYKLQFKDAKDYSIFFDPELIRKVDAFIELGFAEFIKNRPNYIFHNIDNSIKRLRVCRSCGMTFNKYEEIDKVIRTTQFVIDGNLISDNDLDTFIPDATKVEANPVALTQIINSKITKVEDKEIPELEQYKKNPLVYKINGVTVSRQKVLRNLSILENSETCKNLPRNILLFNALICGSVFDYHQLAILNNSLNQDIEKLEK